MKRNLFIAFLVLIMALFSGCESQKRENEQVIVDTDLNVTNYYFAASRDSAKELAELCCAYNDRMTGGMALSLSNTYFNDKMLTANLKTNFTGDENSNKIENENTIKLGFVEGIFATKNGDEIEGYFHSIAVSSAMKAFRGIDIEKRIYSSDTDVLNALKSAEIDIAVGVSDNTDNDLIFSDAFCSDRLVLYSTREISDMSSATIYTTDKRKTFAAEFTKSKDIVVKSNVSECVSQLTDSKGTTAVFVMLSELGASSDASSSNS